MPYSTGFWESVWPAFNKWRKTRWPFRVLVIVLIFGFPLFERVRGHLLISDLVEIACRAIYIGYIPQAEHALCRFYKASEANRLHTMIVRYADANMNATLDADEMSFLREEGCDLREIRKRGTRADLEILARDARKLGLLPKAYSAKKARRAAFFTARCETEMEFDPQISEVYALIRATNSIVPRYSEKQKESLKYQIDEEQFKLLEPDYLSWKTWAGKIDSAFYELNSVIGPIVTTISWFFLSVFASVLAAVNIRKYKKIPALIASLAILVLLLLLSGKIPYSKLSSLSWFNYEGVRIYFLLFSLICLSVAAALIGERLSEYAKNLRVWNIGAAAVAGIAMASLCWSFCFYHPCHYCYGGIGSMLTPSTIFQKMNIYDALSFFLIIAALLISTGLTVFLYNYRRKRMPDHIPDTGKGN